VLENYAFTMNRNQCSTSPEYALIGEEIFCPIADIEYADIIRTINEIILRFAFSICTSSISSNGKAVGLILPKKHLLVR
jgi:hypothetical protein